jgi:hypothetical protein
VRSVEKKMSFFFSYIPLSIIVQTMVKVIDSGMMRSVDNIDNSVSDILDAASSPVSA